MPGYRTAHDREDLVFAATAAVISTGDEKNACPTRMTPQDIHRRPRPDIAPVFRRYSPADICTTSAHLLLRISHHGRTTPQSNNKGTAMSHRFTIDALKELIVARSDAEQGLRVCAECVRKIGRAHV